MKGRVLNITSVETDSRGDGVKAKQKFHNTPPSDMIFMVLAL